MSPGKLLATLLKDSPPEFAFELSEAGIAAAGSMRPPQLSFQPLEPDVLSVSPLRDNLLRPEALLAKVRALAPPGENRKHRQAALILPDYSVRVSVLDFDAFPSSPQEQLSLVRFRIKKSVPFDVESAALSYHPQPSAGNGKKFDVVVAVAPLEIVARYEAPFRAAGFQPGLVTTSTLAALELARGSGVTVLAKLCGRVLTVSVLDGRILKLARSVELSEASRAEIAAILYPTFAYIEDHLARKAEKLLLCGFGSLEAELREELKAELGIPAEPLSSRYGTPGEYNAGLLGYLESVEGG